MKLYLVDLGVLLKNDNPEYNAYKAYDKMHSFYDTIQYFVTDKDKAIEDAKKHVKITGEGGYAVVSETEYTGNLTDEEVNDLSVEKYADYDNVIFSCTMYTKDYYRENFVDISRIHPERVINDVYHKNESPQFGDDPATPFNTRVRAVNDMYGYLYNKGILKKESFVSKDYSDALYFAINTKGLESYREEMINSGIENAELAVRHIFDEKYDVCVYCGAITLGWLMVTYRDTCGCVGKSWECSGCKHFENSAVSKVAEVRRAKGVMEAVKYEWSLFKWDDGTLED